MDIEQIRTEKRTLEQEAGEALDKLMKDFEERTGETVQDVSVSIDRMGTPIGLQVHYEPVRVRVTLSPV